jgi:hypothetical protein
MNYLDRKTKEAKEFLKYRQFLQHPFLTIQAKKDYDDIKKENGILDNLYNELPYKLTNQNKSDIRHPFASAVLTQKYPEQLVRELGQYKEDVDILKNKPLWDTEEDLKNNELGIELGKKYPNMSPNNLFYLILDEKNLAEPLKEPRFCDYFINNDK